MHFNHQIWGLGRPQLVFSEFPKPLQSSQLFGGLCMDFQSCGISLIFPLEDIFPVKFSYATSILGGNFIKIYNFLIIIWGLGRPQLVFSEFP